jgi:peroxiredoxin family protein
MANKASILVLSDHMDKACAAFHMAIGAAASGMEVVMLFTCFGINILKKPGVGHKGDDYRNKMLNFMTRGGMEKINPSKMSMMGMSRFMMKRLMKKKNMQSIPELLAEAKELGVKIWLCDNPVHLSGLQKEDFIDEVDEIVGVFSYIKEASESEINLSF